VARVEQWHVAFGASRTGQALVIAARCFGQATILLAAFNLARAFGLLGPPVVSVSLLTATLMLIAWRAKATRADLGLAREDMREGVRYGVGALGLVLLVLVAIAVIPGTNGFLHDSRADISGGRLIYELAISIVLLTAIPEEFAFRGVLLGSGVLLWGPWRASLITSALFGLWHIAPTLHTMSENRAVSGASNSFGGQVLLVTGTVIATFMAGLVFSWLRLRSRSLIAPILAHIATNGLALLIAWLVAR
jgi:membrane protease YdiL (CAAX protease family)